MYDQGCYKATLYVDVSVIFFFFLNETAFAVSLQCVRLSERWSTLGRSVESLATYPVLCFLFLSFERYKRS